MTVSTLLHQQAIILLNLCMYLHNAIICKRSTYIHFLGFLATKRNRTLLNKGNNRLNPAPRAFFFFVCLLCVHAERESVCVQTCAYAYAEMPTLI